MRMRRELAAALTAALMAGSAWAEHPGALWSVERLEVRTSGAAEALTADVHATLRAANEVYFYGDQPVRMVATVADSGVVHLDLIDIATGEVLIRGAKLGTDGLERDLETDVLAWMDALDCPGGACAVEAPVQIASVPVTTTEPDARADAVVAEAKVADAEIAKPRDLPWPQKVTGVLSPAEPQQIAQAGTGTPLPKRRPGTEAAPDLDGLRSVVIARNPDLSVAPIRISRFDTRGLTPISYSAEDRLVLRVPLARTPQATQVLPPPKAAERSLIGRWMDNVASFLGFSAPEPAQPSTRVAALPSTSLETVSTFVPPGTPLKTSDQWKAKPAEPTVAETRVAALDTTQVGGRSVLAPPRSARTALPRAEEQPERQQATVTTSIAQPEYTATGLRIVRSPGLGLPDGSADLIESPLVTPIRIAAATGTGVPKNLAVKIHPEVFGKYSNAAAARLFGGYGSSAPVRLVSAAPDGGSAESVDRILANRGLALDSDSYAKAERIFWSGRSGSRGFWITLPQVSPSSYVLVASPKASVIANVYARGSSVQVSDSVAKALGLAPGQWSDVQIIALKPVDRTAARKTVSVTR